VTPKARPERGALAEVAAVFLKLGLIGFGGPAAHVALMRREVVDRRRWVTQERFLELFAASNLIPGPTSTELAIFLGQERAGWPALILAGALFIVPAMAIVLTLAGIYVRIGSVPATGWVLYGVTPVAIGIVADALWQLGRTALRTIWLLLLAAAVVGLYFVGVNVLVLLLGGGLVAMLVTVRRRPRTEEPGVAAFVPTLSSGLAAAASAASVSMTTLFLTFLKIGAVLYGGGYVLLAFLRADFVSHLHWITDRQLVDAVSIGQVTPGPLFTTATFVGYVVGGFRGALVATAAIFLPSFGFVALVYRWLPRFQNSPSARVFLRGATASALGLMAAVTAQLGRAVIVDPFTALLAVAAFVVLRRFQPNSVWLILAGAVAGILAKLI
jgi:chromate transporter